MAHKTTPSIQVRSVVSKADARESGQKRYFTGLPCKHGHIAERRTADGGCIRCRADACLATQKRYYANDGDAFRARRREYWNDRPEVKMFLGVRSRARKRGYQCTITAKDIVIPENCPCCGVTLEVRTGPSKQGAIPTSPSLDQINAKKGYTPDNIAVICWRCNALKHDASIAELKMVVAWMERMAMRDNPWLRLVG